MGQNKHQAFGANIIVKDEKTDSQVAGMFITQGDKNKLRVSSATVTSVGQSVEGIQEGDKIWYKQGQSTKADLDGDLVTIVRFVDVVIVSRPSEDGQE